VHLCHFLGDIGMLLHDMFRHSLNQFIPRFRSALDFVAQGKVKTIVETYPLAETPKVYQRVVESKTRFRAGRKSPLWCLTKCSD